MGMAHHLIFRPWMLNGHPGNITRPVKRYIRRGVNAGLVCTSTTDGGHAPNSYHFRHPGQAADMAAPLTAEGVAKMRRFQEREARSPGRFNELFGPTNSACVKNGVRITLAEGTGLENQHDNHVHGAPRS